LVHQVNMMEAEVKNHHPFQEQMVVVDSQLRIDDDWYVSLRTQDIVQKAHHPQTLSISHFAYVRKQKSTKRTREESEDHVELARIHQGYENTVQGFPHLNLQRNRWPNDGNVKHVIQAKANQ